MQLRTQAEWALWVQDVAVTVLRGPLSLFLGLAGFPLSARWPESNWRAVWTSRCVHGGGAVSGWMREGASVRWGVCEL